MGYPTSSRFWAASSAWYSARKEAQAKAAAGGGPKPSLAHNEQLWRSQGARYLRGRPDLSASMVRVDPRLSEAILKFIDEINPSIAAAMDKHLGSLAFRAWREWPVSSGLSKSLLGLEYVLDGEDRFVGQVVNTAPYVFFIEGSPHRKLLEAPAPATAVRIVADVQRALARVAP